MWVRPVFGKFFTSRLPKTCQNDGAAGRCCPSATSVLSLSHDLLPSRAKSAPLRIQRLCSSPGAVETLPMLACLSGAQRIGLKSRASPCVAGRAQAVGKLAERVDLPVRLLAQHVERHAGAVEPGHP